MDLDRIAQIASSGAWPLLRTDFSSDDAWRRVVAELEREVDMSGDGDLYAPALEAVSDPALASVTADVLARSWPSERHGYAILADDRSMREAQSGDQATAVLVALGTGDEPTGEAGAASFRCVLGEIAGIEANLAISNMDYAEFADSVDDDGVFRGF